MNAAQPQSSPATNDLSPPRPPELLAPAGDWECARAAVENGADAIYFGLEKFNARMRANNFTEADLPALMEFLHRRGVRGYVTFNTLIFADELPQATRYLRSVIASGVDAAIVQDIGICRLIRRLSPDFPIHASTQMTVTSTAGVEFARELGCNLVVLARECSLKEISAIRSAAPPVGAASLPLEVFVHGALCVAYSGQCLTSESLGGRSANRGECAQACRMPYELLSDGQPVPLGDRRYLLSPQDLAGIDVLPELIRAGVASLKIEGRLKSPEYVANVTRVYRQAIDRLVAAPGTPQSTGPTAPGRTTTDRYELEMAFSRGLHTGWFGGINNQQLVHARFGTKRGVFLGTVSRIQGERVALRLQAPLKAGDGIVFDAGRPDEPEEGGRVYSVDTRGADTWIAFGRGDLNFARVHTGDRVWKTSDPELDRRLRQSFADGPPRFHRPLCWEVHGATGLPLTLVARDEQGHVTRRASTMPLVAAERQPLDTARLEAQLGRLGGTGFRIGGIENHLEGEVMIPVSELNRLRREAVDALLELRARPPRWNLLPEDPASARVELLATTTNSAAPPGAAELIVLVRDLPQLEAALQCGIDTLYCEFEDPRRYREAVRRVRESTGCAQPSRSIWVAPPRITKPGEEWILKQVRACDADGYLVRNYDHLGFFRDCRRLGDFSLNVANGLTAEYLVGQHGLERVTASYDLNISQLGALLQSAPPAWFEITLHQHMPMFHMEHCVFCAFLSKGTDFTNCGRPCDRHRVELRDRVGARHPLKADAGCRNTVFNALAQTGAEFFPHLLAWGARHFRIEFLNEEPDQVARTIARYRQLLRGELSGARLWQELRLLNQLGVTRGQLASVPVGAAVQMPSAKVGGNG